MMTNDLLQEKWRTQERMAQDAGNNIKTFLDNNEQLVAQMLREHGVTLVYFTQRGSREKFERAMRHVVDVEPAEYDRL